MQNPNIVQKTCDVQPPQPGHVSRHDRESQGVKPSRRPGAEDDPTALNEEGVNQGPALPGKALWNLAGPFFDW